MTIRLLVADDHPWILEGLRHVFQRTEIEIVAEAMTAGEAVRIALEQAVNVVLLDVRMPDGGGAEALSQIKAIKRNMPVLIFSAHDRADMIQRCMGLGAAAYLRKGVDDHLLVDAVRRAAAREMLDGDARRQADTVADDDRAVGDRSC